jgi:hypothetical protein
LQLKIGWLNVIAMAMECQMSPRPTLAGTMQVLCTQKYMIRYVPRVGMIPLNTVSYISCYRNKYW